MNLIFLVLFFLFLVFLVIFWNKEYRYYIGSPQVNFIENDYLKIGLYPGDFRAVFLLSIDDLHGKTKEKDFLKVLNALEKHGVKATFFTIPLFREKYEIQEERVKKIVEKGHEVALHGFSHRLKKKIKLPWEVTCEFKSLGYEEQEKKIKEGKKIFEKLGVAVHGFRTPHFSSSYDTPEILAKQGFQYFSDVRIWPEGKITNKRFLGALYGSVYYPYFWSTVYGEILIIPTNGDYVWDITRIIKKPDFFSAKKRFMSYYEANGVFCLLTHIHRMGINSRRGMSFLEKFLKEMKAKEVWNPAMKEFAAWWGARAKLNVKTAVEGNLLKIYLEKPLAPLNNLRFEIKHKGNYEIYLKEQMIKSGKSPEKIYLNI